MDTPKSAVLALNFSRYITICFLYTPFIHMHVIAYPLLFFLDMDMAFVNLNHHFPWLNPEFLSPLVHENCCPEEVLKSEDPCGSR